MGRLIDIDEARNEYRNLMDLTMSDTTLLHTLYGVLDNAPTVEAIPKDQYEARLKSDMVAMLEEIQMEIEEHKMTSGVTNQGTWNECIACCSSVIQQKINLLRSKN